MTSNQLSRGALAKITKGDLVSNPILQVTSIKSLATESSNPQSGKVKFKVTLTDGIDSSIGMVATQLCELIINKTIRENTLIQLIGYTPTVIQNNSFIVIAALEVVGQADTSFLAHASSNPATNPPYSSNNALNNPYANNNPYSPVKSNVQAPYGGVNPYQQQNYVNPYASNTSPVKPNNPSSVAYNSPTKAVNPYGGSTNQSYGQSSSIAGYSTYGSMNNNSNTNKSVIRNDINDLNIIPINAVNPYSNKWTIKARITSKSAVRSWSNAKGDGTLFSIDLLDNSGKEIRATFFKEACTKFYPILEEGKVYLFSSGRVKPVANKQYTSIKNDYELTFDERSDIRPVADDDDSIKSQQYNFIKINQINNIDPNQTIDVIGIVKSYSEVAEIVSTKLGGKSLTKRDINIVDSTGAEIRLTLWGDRASAPTKWEELPIIAVKSVKVGEFGGRSLSSLNNTVLSINPQVQEAFDLYQWRSQFPGGRIPDDVVVSLSSGMGERTTETFDKRKSISSLRDDGLGLSDKADYVTIKATVNYIKHDNDPWYAACTTPGCNKKVVENFGGGYRCEKCDKTIDNCIRRYILSLTLADDTGNAWFSIFNDEAVKLLGHTADELHNLKMEGLNDMYEEIFAKANFQTFVIKARVKQENVNGDMRMKNTVFKLDKVDYVSESKFMLEAINKLI